MENEIDFTLPEWVFLNGNSHLGNSLKERNVLQHNETITIIEFFLLIDEYPIKLDSLVKSKKFNYTNILGEIESHLVAVHFSMLGDFELYVLLDQAIEFYKRFMDWEDTSLDIEETSQDN